VAELRTELSSRGLDTTGIKKILMARLVEAWTSGASGPVDDAMDEDIMEPVQVNKLNRM
jgi:hypothetical protein